ncbi:hypothetical protein Rmet_6040 (plasmid) [Cupriavidus metallidurans CH34]|uniref:Uncharacterized protein n=1 Tax=Cupriavidus metallidurans (strain ATCC 43123 / DSM 2839 / NBRC 102507 / CH34) TaxID=266264 RepID=Q1LAC7_CUPMC|nr:hypothetical protein Rmet_6040 [Cupriavidus metallidurans CH34]
MFIERHAARLPAFWIPKLVHPPLRLALKNHYYAAAANVAPLLAPTPRFVDQAHRRFRSERGRRCTDTPKHRVHFVQAKHRHGRMELTTNERHIHGRVVGGKALTMQRLEPRHEQSTVGFANHSSQL